MQMAKTIVESVLSDLEDDQRHYNEFKSHLKQLKHVFFNDRSSLIAQDELRKGYDKKQFEEMLKRYQGEYQEFTEKQKM